MNQVAQAFAWAAPRFLAEDGECGLLLPAMGLFEEPSGEFRRKFFRRFQVHSVANFANLAEVLFDGHSRVPAMAVFYRLRPVDSEPMSDEPITIYSPFVVNQEATCPLASGERRKLWGLVLNGSEVQTLELGEVADGSGLPWKLAMWGTPWDERLVRRLEKKWDVFGKLEDDKIIFATQGLELRGEPDEEKTEDVDGRTRGRSSARTESSVASSRRNSHPSPSQRRATRDDFPPLRDQQQLGESAGSARGRNGIDPARFDSRRPWPAFGGGGSKAFRRQQREFSGSSHHGRRYHLQRDLRRQRFDPRLATAPRLHGRSRLAQRG